MRIVESCDVLLLYHSFYSPLAMENDHHFCYPDLLQWILKSRIHGLELPISSPPPTWGWRTLVNQPLSFCGRVTLSETPDTGLSIQTLDAVYLMLSLHGMGLQNL